jgi:hypothetical protein
MLSILPALAANRDNLAQHALEAEPFGRTPNQNQFGSPMRMKAAQ